MPRAEVGTPKWVANKMKSKGLQRLRWYCQVCQKQCRDENGFKMHVSSESHLRQMIVVGENAGRHISDFSAQFQSEFVQLLSRRFGTKRVKANNVYQEYIQDKHHLHMNATRWVTLTEFIKYLGRSGFAHVDETDKGWFIAWIDRSPKALEKQEASLKKERATMNDEQRERLLIEEQIERAEREARDKGEGTSTAGATEEEGQERKEGLQREEGEKKVVLSFSARPVASSSSTDPSEGIKLNPLKPAAKRTNPLKQTPTTSSAGGKRKETALSAAEKLIAEDQERKRRRGR
ncbi:domain of Kin17 curved DNA-binding protein-domain-containing protein [Russula earlei]|uniref:Domain of Kin17 curved DNA-binding protein-domain-containing protein n=1 Tax=Russula earlei TaxID=71964 RepID=A0ACC0UC37_9AGAM|nr:domain of Kin17 curved DNA-binding protein-domain-containing protein [Russula earlei]